jgi:hypothetical protein
MQHGIHEEYEPSSLSSNTTCSLGLLSISTVQGFQEMAVRHTLFSLEMLACTDLLSTILHLPVLALNILTASKLLAQLPFLIFGRLCASLLVEPDLSLNCLQLEVYHSENLSPISCSMLSNWSTDAEANHFLPV